MAVVIPLFIFNINNLLNCNKRTQPHPLKTASQVCEILSLMPLKVQSWKNIEKKKTQEYISDNLIMTKADIHQTVFNFIFLLIH